MKFLAIVCLLVAPVLWGKGATGHYSKCSTCSRSAKGAIQRSPAAVKTFKRQTGYPHGRKGYVVDHIKPLCAGGVDAPGNMQWQTVEAAKTKDKIERTQCR